MIDNPASRVIDAAAAADWQAHNAAILKTMTQNGTLDDKRRWISHTRSRAAVSAALRVLAEEFEGIGEGDCHPADTLLRLADEVAPGSAVSEVTP